MKAIKKFFKSDFFMLLCIIIAVCGLMGGCLYAGIYGGSVKLANIVSITQLFWVFPLVTLTIKE